MTEIDRAQIVRELDARHDQLLVDLDDLNRQVERVLSAVRPVGADVVICAKPQAASCARSASGGLR